MANKLIIHFNEHSNEIVDWALVDPTGNLLKQQSNCKIQTIEPEDTGCELIALVPGTSITIKAIEIPHAPYTRMLRALPYAVEPELIPEPEELHFAVGKRNSDDTLNIAYATNETIDNWRSAMQNIKCIPSAIFPDNLLLPLNDGEWSIFIQDKIAMVRTAKQAGFCIEIENLLETLELTLTEQPPTAITIYNLEPNSDLANKLQQLSIKLEFETTPDYLTLASQEVTSPTAINLLQAKYRPGSKLFHPHHPWRIAVKLLILWLLILVVGNVGLLGYLKVQQYLLNKQIITMYQKVFPSTTTLANPRQTIKAEMQKYDVPLQTRGFIYLLGKTGTIIHAMPKIKLTRLKFSNQKLTIQITTDNFNDIDKLSHTLRSQGLQVKRDLATTKNQKAVAELTIGSTNVN